MADTELRHGWTPNPDPTVLTTEQLQREILSLRESLQAQIFGVRDVLSSRMEGFKTFYDAGLESIKNDLLSRGNVADTKIQGQHDLFGSRLDGMEKAVTLLQNISDRIPAQMDDKVAHLRNLHQEKFDSITTQFVERDVRTEQTAAGVKIAVDAALQAAKEAVGEQNRSFALATAKSEAATTKQIDAQALSIQTAYKGLDDKIIDMKDRLTRIEAMGLGVARGTGEFQERQHETNSLQNIAATLDLQRQQVSHSGNQNMINIAAAILAAGAIAISLWHSSNGPMPLVATVPANPPTLQRQSETFLPLGWQLSPIRDDAMVFEDIMPRSKGQDK